MPCDFWVGPYLVVAWPQNGYSCAERHSVARNRQKTPIFWPQNGCEQHQGHSVDRGDFSLDISAATLRPRHFGRDRILGPQAESCRVAIFGDFGAKAPATGL